MKQNYSSPEMEIRWFETEDVIMISDESNIEYIPETDGGKDAFGG